mmetsp:Transcript_63250/g.100575  ORF Transcript_63250/g.100575 Transcript_63250/m.100575 type:complete len:96 (-) Transcript_63250:120-407(-)
MSNKHQIQINKAQAACLCNIRNNGPSFVCKMDCLSSPHRHKAPLSGCFRHCMIYSNLYREKKNAHWFVGITSHKTCVLSNSFGPKTKTKHKTDYL